MPSLSLDFYIYLLLWIRSSFEGFIFLYSEVWVVVGFWSALGLRHVSHLIKTARSRRQDVPANHLLEHYSSVFEATSSESTTAPRTLILWAPPSRSRGNSSRSERDIYNNRPHWSSHSIQQAFNSTRRTLLIHGVSYAAKSSHILNIATVLLQRVVTDGSSQQKSPQIIRSIIRELWRNPNVQILQLWRFVISAPFIMICRVFIHLDLHQAKEHPEGSNPKELNL